MQQPIWTPDARWMAEAQVSRLAAALGLDGFDALYSHSIAQPDSYWRAVMSVLGIRWVRPYARYVDLPEGPPFPRWFPGGELNWVNTILGHAEDPSGADRPAVVAETEAGVTTSVTYHALREQVARFAGGLQARGIGRGDRVGLLFEASVEAVVSLLALSYLGAIAVPLFSGFGVDAIVSRLAGCGARALVATTGFDRRGRRIGTVAMLAQALPQLPGVEQIILKGPAGEQASLPGAVPWQEVGAGPALPEAARMAADDPMMVIYTSGTTGKPKGAVHTHGGFPIKIAHDAAVHFDIAPGDVFFWPADMGWVAGPLTIASALMRGATLVCYDGAPDFPDWSRLSRLVAAHRVTHLGASPTLIRGLAASPALATVGSLASVRLLITAGEVIDPEHMTWYQRHMGRGVCPVINYSGGTEVSGGLIANVVVRPIFPGAFNAVSPGVQIEVLDESGQPVRDGAGELTILQPFVGMTQSFWQDRERYLETYWRQIPGVWTHGDLALRTGGNALFLLGRSDDTLKVAGKRLGPAEVEDVLLELPEVSEAAAIGVDDAKKGQMLVVFVVPSPDAKQARSGLPDKVMAAVESRLGRPFRPGRVHLVAQLPKTRSGKVMRRIIRSAYAGQPPGDVTSIDDLSALGEIRAASAAT